MPGVFTTCTEMRGSGFKTGTTRDTTHKARRAIRKGLPPESIEWHAEVPLCPTRVRFACRLGDMSDLKQASTITGCVFFGRPSAENAAHSHAALAILKLETPDTRAHQGASSDNFVLLIPGKGEQIGIVSDWQSAQYAGFRIEYYTSQKPRPFRQERQNDLTVIPDR